MDAKLFFLICLLPAFTIGCAIGQVNKANLPGIDSVEEPLMFEPEPVTVEEGSLWSEASGMTLYPDMRARRIGDVVTVMIVEDPEAELKANTTSSRSSSIDAKLKFFDVMNALTKKHPNIDPDELISASLGSDFKGEGTSDRGGHVKAYVSARVIKVLPNGNMQIYGSREIRVNNETQYITLSGLIRPEDISPSTNEISSMYVADAKITYSGKGVLSDKQRPGWLGRIVDYVWPF